MGMSYDELTVFGQLRKVERCGPYSMFTKLLHEWQDQISPTQVCRYFICNADLLDRREGQAIFLLLQLESS